MAFDLPGWLTRHFVREDIDGHGACPTPYLYRWVLWHHSSGRGIYLHHFVGGDWSRELHDHPKRFVSIGLWGGYVEETPDIMPDHDESGWLPWLGHLKREYFEAPWIRSFPAHHRHRLRLHGYDSCWTLIYVGPRQRDWGFWHEPYGDKQHEPYFVPWRLYVDDRRLVEEVKDCG